jgi:integral membrane protein
MILQLLTTPLGRLRILGFFEGISLILLVFIAVPLKYWGGQPALVKVLGPIHGLLFTMFVLATLSAAVSYHWKFRETSWKILVACMIPFGTFYIDRHILSREQSRVENQQ